MQKVTRAILPSGGAKSCGEVAVSLSNMEKTHTVVQKRRKRCKDVSCHLKLSERRRADPRVVDLSRERHHRLLEPITRFSEAKQQRVWLQAIFAQAVALASLQHEPSLRPR